MSGWGYDLKPYILFTLFLGVLMGGCGMCGVKYIHDHIDIDVKVRE